MPVCTASRRRTAKHVPVRVVFRQIRQMPLVVPTGRTLPRAMIPIRSAEARSMQGSVGLIPTTRLRVACPLQTRSGVPASRLASSFAARSFRSDAASILALPVRRMGRGIGAANESRGELPEPRSNRSGRVLTMPVRSQWRTLVLLGLAVLGVACSSDSSGPESTGGATSTGGGGSGGVGAAGGTGGSVSSGGAAGALPVCAVCAIPWFTCSTPGFESVNFQVESQTSAGCDGHIVQVGGPTDAYSIDCHSGQVCGPTGCLAATLTDTSFAWGNATCTASSK
jgi:hypothetical protein